MTLQAWGVNNPLVLLWQRQLLRLLFPLLAALVRRAFSVNDANFGRSVEHIEALLADLNSRLMDKRQSLLGGDELNYTDIAFASMTGLWLMPTANARGRRGVGGGLSGSRRFCLGAVQKGTIGVVAGRTAKR